jgi:hypothetical protein
VVGCAESPRPSVPPRAAKPVVANVELKVPGMTWGSWPQNVSAALATLPWVEQGSIKADRFSRSVKFGINDKQLFDLEEIRNTLPSKYRDGLELVSGPETKTSSDEGPKTTPDP